MLSPDSRSLYTSALTPPPGYVFDQGLATTYSLDPSVLLAIPLHLALLGSGREEALLRDPMALLEALRRTSERLTVYSQQGAIHVPSMPHVLYGLLERVIVEVVAPGGGVFHPKLWVLKFVDPTEVEPPLLRLMILSRNLTGDRSWDLSLLLEGTPRGKNVGANKELGELIARLPSFARGEVSAGRREQAESLAQAVRATQWELPEGFEEYGFHVLGLKRKPWILEPSDELAVISPFISEQALISIAESTREPLALVSRPDSLEKIAPTVRGRYKRCLVLQEAAESEDGEAVEETAELRDDVGLHAKAIVLKRGWNTHLLVGSANATHAAMVAGMNVEVIAELVGRRSQVGGIESLLGPSGMQEVLVDYESPASPAPLDAERLEAEKMLAEARKSLMDIGLSLTCSADGSDWLLTLKAARPPVLDGVAAIRAWPLTIKPEQAADAMGLGSRQEVNLGRYGSASITGLTAFELMSRKPGVVARFTLNLPVTGLPEDREAAVMRTVLRNRDGFLRYLMLLLGEYGNGDLFTAGGLFEPGQSQDWGSGFGGVALLEQLTRAFGRDQERLLDVERVVARLSKGQAEGEIVPKDFLDLWEVFREAMAAEKGGNASTH